MLGALVGSGMEVAADAALADALIINTCAFIDAAQEESVDAILEAGAGIEAQRPLQALIVAGCLPQRFGDQLPELLPEVDAFMGVDQVAQAPAIVRAALQRRMRRTALGRRSAAAAPAPRVAVHRRPSFIHDCASPRFRLTPAHYAYLKIAEGCNHPCSFCLIPRIRGSHRSRDQADVVAEARQLLEGGARELNLVSQDTTYYGLDRRPDRRGTIASPDRFGAATRRLPAGAATLAGLLRELNALPGDFWIRLLYTHPAHWTDELIDTIAACPKVARYVDLPLQHVAPLMLERMRRETSAAHVVDLIRRLRAGIPGLTLRTTFLVGFPGETRACFERLLEFIRETRFERLGVFAYSREAGTAAGAMTGQVPLRVRHRRREQLMAAQQAVARDIARAYVGRTLKVLVDQNAGGQPAGPAEALSGEHGLSRDAASSLPCPRCPGGVVARSEADAPDIDGRVYIRARLPIGQFAQVRVVGHSDYDLFAEPVRGAGRDGAR